MAAGISGTAGTAGTAGIVGTVGTAVAFAFVSPAQPAIAQIVGTVGTAGTAGPPLETWDEQHPGEHLAAAVAAVGCLLMISPGLHWNSMRHPKVPQAVVEFAVLSD